MKNTGAPPYVPACLDAQAVHGLTSELQSAALFEHVFNGDIFRGKAKLSERCQGSLHLIRRRMDQEVKVTGEPGRAVESNRITPDVYEGAARIH